MNKVKIACCQLSLKIGDAIYNRGKSLDSIRKAIDLGAKVIILPELVNSGYVFNDKEEALSLAEPYDGDTIRAWIYIAKKFNIVIVGGFCERLSRGSVANSAVLIDRSGVKTVYRKAHLWYKEKNIFTAGTEQPDVIDTSYGRLAVMICYDLEFPEWVRIPAVKGAQLLCAPVNWPVSFKPEGERHIETIKSQANAANNRMYIAICDRCETERQVSWVGGSVIIDVNGFPLTKSLKNEGIISSDIFLPNADQKNINSYNNVILDRNVKIY